MTEPTTILDQYKAEAAQYGGEAWIEELLIRGSPQGVQGAHLVIGTAVPVAFGSVQTQVHGPFPVNAATEDDLWEAIKTELYVSLTQQNLDLQQQLLNAEGQIEALEQQVSSLQQQLSQQSQQQQSEPSE